MAAPSRRGPEPVRNRIEPEPDPHAPRDENVTIESPARERPTRAGTNGAALPPTQPASARIAASEWTAIT